MKNLDWKHYVLGIAVIVLIILSLTKSCDTTEETKITITDKEVKIPEVSGEFKEPSNQSEIPVSEPDTVFIGKPIYLPSPLQESLLDELKSAKDSISRYKVLADAARKREYSSDFEDENVKINVKTTVYGKLDNNEIKYLRKEIKTTVKETLKEVTTVKNKTTGILIMGGINRNLDTQKTNYEAGIGYRYRTISILGTATTDKTVGIKTIIEF